MEKGDQGLFAQRNDILHAHSRPPQRRMAVSKPVRVLAASCMCLFFFLMLQMMRNPTPLDAFPGSTDKDGDIKSFVRDPNLDGRQKSARPNEPPY
jgi:hypothetical protein